MRAIGFGLSLVVVLSMLGCEDDTQLWIHPDECIDCGACEPECPVTAIFPEEDVPPEWTEYIAKNRDIFDSDTPPGPPQG